MIWKISLTLIILYIFAIIAIQFGLATTTVREVFTPMVRLEGISNATVIDNIGIVEVELSVGDFEPNNLRILVNGQFAGTFNEPNVWLAVRNNSLIEIDGTNEMNPFHVSVSNISDNAMDVSRELEVIVNGGIVILGKIHAY